MNNLTIDLGQAVLGSTGLEKGWIVRPEVPQAHPGLNVEIKTGRRNIIIIFLIRNGLK